LLARLKGSVVVPKATARGASRGVAVVQRIRTQPCHFGVTNTEEEAMRTALAMAVVLVPAMWLATPVAAAPAATLHVSPPSQAAGGSVQVSGTCEANTSGHALSHAFLHDAAHDFAGVGAVAFQTDAAGNFSVTAEIPSSTTPGRYDVTARCGGGNLGITATLTVTPASGKPTAVPAGSGGLAPTGSSASQRAPIALAVIGGALLAVGGLGFARRRASH